MTIGEHIQKLRIQKRLTQERLAEILDVSRQSVSKWELGQSVPDIEKIIRMSDIFGVSTDTLLLHSLEKEAVNDNPLHLGTIYLIVKNFERSVDFYEKFLGVKVSDRCRSGNKFVNLYFDNKCLSLMNESNLAGHNTELDSPYKFVQNYWVEDLLTEYDRVKGLNIGEVTEIYEAYPTYHYFNLYDPDQNVIEITGGYYVCQSCGMEMRRSDHGTNADRSLSNEYCKFCYRDGKFTDNMTLNEKIESNIPFWIGDTFDTEEKARAYLNSFFPTLKRWKNT